MRALKNLIIIHFLAAFSLLAQEALLDIGTAQDPPGIRWQTLTTPHLKLIFPQELGRDAQQIANLIDSVYPLDTQTLGVRPPRIPLILRNRTTESNGFAALGPRRSEWFNTPPQTSLIGPVSWYTLLAIHEYRHVVQFERMKGGMTKWLYYLMGDAGWMAGAMFSVPFWFWEGDAVFMETALTCGGRGRQPEFFMPVRTMLLSDERYSYHKMTMGSLKNWSADPYEYGFLMNTYLRRRHGAGLWPQVLHRTNKISLMPFRFSQSLKKYTGMGAIKSHNAALAELDSVYKSGHAQTAPDTVKRWDRNHNGHTTHYRAPAWLDDGSAMVLKYGLTDQPAFVRIDPSGNEHTLLHPNPVDGTPHHVIHDKLIWNEFNFDERWGNQNFQSLKIHDLQTGRTQTVVAKGHYFAPALSPDGVTIAAIYFGTDNRCQLVLLNLEGKELRRFDNTEQAFLFTPHWSADGNRIAYGRLTARGRTLALVDVSIGETQDLFPAGANTLASPSFWGSYLLFTTADGDVEQIFACHLDSRQLYRTTARPFGAAFPDVSPDGKRLLYNDYDLHGWHVAEMALDTTKWTAIEQLPLLTNPWFEPVAHQESEPIWPGPIPQKEYAVENYHPWRDLFQVHSWLITADEAARTAGLQVFARDLLGTLGSSAGVDYDRAEKAAAVNATITYAGLYPLLDVSAEAGHRASSFIDDKDLITRYTWHEKSLMFGLRLPLNLTRNGYWSGAALQSHFAMTGISRISDDRGFDHYDNADGWFKSLRHSFIYYHYRQSRADIYPVWGQTLRLSFYHTPLRGDYQGRLFSFSSNLYFPGIKNHQGWALRCDYEEQDAQNYRFSSESRFPRGYSERFHEKMGRIGVDYAVPLCYPDWPLWVLMYIQRIKSAFFFDYGVGRDADREITYRSAGVELTSDVNFLGFPVLFDLGARISWRWLDRSWHAELMLGTPL